MARLSDGAGKAADNGREPLLPWTEGHEDRLFRRMVIAFLLLFLLAGFIINRLSLPEPPQKKLIEVAPRLAKLIQEKKKQPPPPPKPKPKPKPKPEKKKEAEKKKPEPKKKKPQKKKPAAKPKPKARPKPVDRRAAARAKAQKSGLIALQDDLADLRQSIDTTDLGVTPQRKAGHKAETLVSNPNLIARKATAGSGGIRSNSANRKVQNRALAQRKTTAVASRIDSAAKIAQKAGGKKSRSAARSQEEIERVFQKNKGAIFNIYNRELRKDPSLQGKVVIELTIAPNGRVTKARIVSSELHNPRLEKRLLSKVRKFRFANKPVPPITVTYPIDFLPS